MQISRTQNFGYAAKKLANGVTYRNSASNMGGGKMLTAKKLRLFWRNSV
jgi:hypothetical protein